MAAIAALSVPAPSRSGLAALVVAPALAAFGARRPALLALFARLCLGHGALAVGSSLRPRTAAAAVARVPLGAGLFVVIAVAPGSSLRFRSLLPVALRRGSLRPFLRRALRTGGEAHIGL